MSGIETPHSVGPQAAGAGGQSIPQMSEEEYARRKTAWDAAEHGNTDKHERLRESGLNTGRLFWIAFSAFLLAHLAGGAVLWALNGTQDSDGDGVRNISDRCPLVSGLGWNNGCPR